MTLSKSRRFAVVAVVSACIGGVGTVGVQPAAAKVKSCPDVGNRDYPEKKHGGYITNFRVTSVSCASAKKLAVAYTKCRLKNGIKGTCKSSKVNGFKCTEKRPSSGDNGTEFNASVTCKTGAKKVVFAYQQNY
jgi:hypothetical protein